MTGTPKLLGLYVQPDHEERDTEGRLSLLAGFAVEVIEVTDREEPQGAGGRVFEGRTFGLGRREMQHTPPYSTPSREALVGAGDLRRTGSGGVARRRESEVAQGGETPCWLRGRSLRLAARTGKP